MVFNVIKALREKRGYTQQQVANFLNIDRSTYAYYESGKTKPDINSIMKLAEIFNVSWIELLENEKPPALFDSSFSKKGSDDALKEEDPCVAESQELDISEKEMKLITYFRLLRSDIQEEVIKSLFNIYKRIIDIK